MKCVLQVYSFDDPTAGSYGNSNFSYMSDYMMFEASLKKRDVLYYGETAYWYVCILCIAVVYLELIFLIWIPKRAIITKVSYYIMI